MFVGIEGLLEFSMDLFKKEMVEVFVGCLFFLFEDAVVDLDKLIGSLIIFFDEECRKLLLVKWIV